VTSGGDSARLRAHIRGRVQGVAYRAHAREEGRRLGLQGWVRNRDDGTVELVAEGPRERLEEMLLWCRRGPRFARVDAVDIDWEEPRDDVGPFEIAG
jgi:acylphosphatase